MDGDQEHVFRITGSSARLSSDAVTHVRAVRCYGTGLCSLEPNTSSNHVNALCLQYGCKHIQYVVVDSFEWCLKINWQT